MQLQLGCTIQNMFNIINVLCQKVVETFVIMVVSLSAIE